MSTEAEKPRPAWTPRRDIGKLEARLGHRFADRKLLHRALTPRFADKKTNFERMEFMGDRLLKAALAIIVDERYPEKDEGELSRIAGLLDTNVNLAFMTVRLKGHLYIRTGKRRKHPQFVRKTLADVFEAVAAAVYFDGGWDALLTVCRKLFKVDLELAQVEQPSEGLAAIALTRRKPFHHETFAKQTKFGILGHVVVLELDGVLKVTGEGFTPMQALYHASAIAMIQLRPQRFQWQLERGLNGTLWAIRS